MIMTINDMIGTCTRSAEGNNWISFAKPHNLTGTINIKIMIYHMMTHSLILSDGATGARVMLNTRQCGQRWTLWSSHHCEDILPSLIVNIMTISSLWTLWSCHHCDHYDYLIFVVTLTIMMVLIFFLNVEFGGDYSLSQHHHCYDNIGDRWWWG